MNFVRWLFYDRGTGEVLYSGMQRGNFEPMPVDKAAAALSLAGAACLEWTSPDPEIEAAFAHVDAEGNPRTVRVRVDISGAEPKPAFAYGPVPEEGENETEDMLAALELLGVAPEEGV